MNAQPGICAPARGGCAGSDRDGNGQEIETERERDGALLKVSRSSSMKKGVEMGKIYLKIWLEFNII